MPTAHPRFHTTRTPRVERILRAARERGLTGPPGEVLVPHHLLALAAHHAGRLVTLDARIEAALTPADRVFVTTLGAA